MTFFKGPEEWPRDTQISRYRSSFCPIDPFKYCCNYLQVVWLPLDHTYHRAWPEKTQNKWLLMKSERKWLFRGWWVRFCRRVCFQIRVWGGSAEISESWMIISLWKQSAQSATWSSGYRYNPLLSALDVISLLYLVARTSAWIKCEPCLIPW